MFAVILREALFTLRGQAQMVRDSIYQSDCLHGFADWQGDDLPSAIRNSQTKYAHYRRLRLEAHLALRKAAQVHGTRANLIIRLQADNLGRGQIVAAVYRFTDDMGREVWEWRRGLLVAGVDTN